MRLTVCFRFDYFYFKIKRNFRSFYHTQLVRETRFNLYDPWDEAKKHAGINHNNAKK